VCGSIRSEIAGAADESTAGLPHKKSCFTLYSASFGNGHPTAVQLILFFLFSFVDLILCSFSIPSLPSAELLFS
jgi:hypothetical protein